MNFRNKSRALSMALGLGVATLLGSALAMPASAALDENFLIHAYNIQEPQFEAKAGKKPKAVPEVPKVAPTITSAASMPGNINSGAGGYSTFKVSAKADNPVTFSLSPVTNLSGATVTNVRATIDKNTGIITTGTDFAASGTFYTTVTVTDTVNGLQATQKFTLPVAFQMN